MFNNSINFNGCCFMEGSDVIMLYIGIDNGLNGGIAIIDDKQEIINLKPMPIIKGIKTHYDIITISDLFKTTSQFCKCYVMLEKSHVRPISGKRASFMTGYGYGLMQGILTTLGISYEIVNPKEWQEEILKGMNTGDTKTDSIMFCKRKYPNVKLTPTERSTKPHDGMSDALCMAVYCWRKNHGGN